MMLRVRPAQLTMTGISSSDSSSGSRWPSSAFGQQVLPGIVMRRYSWTGLPSSSRNFSPRSCFAFNCSAEMFGVPHSCSTISPKVLLGTFTPAKIV